MHRVVYGTVIRPERIPLADPGEVDHVPEGESQVPACHREATKQAALYAAP